MFITFSSFLLHSIHLCDYKQIFTCVTCYTNKQQLGAKTLREIPILPNELEKFVWKIHQLI